MTAQPRAFWGCRTTGSRRITRFSIIRKSLGWPGEISDATDFEVPKLIRLVSAIPKNAMGKVKRNDLTAFFS
jgi:hypothetical protein